VWPAKSRLNFTENGKAILQVTGNYPGEGFPIMKAQLWDVATGEPLGPPITHKSTLLFPGLERNLVASGTAVAIGDETKAEVRV